MTDTDGNRAVRPEAVPLSCGDGDRSCGSRDTCVDVRVDRDHCGQCGVSCGLGTCVDGLCDGPGWSDCVQQDSDWIDCHTTCAAEGLVCGTGCDPLLADSFAVYSATEAGCSREDEGDGAFVVEWDGEDCIASTTLVDTPAWVSCCCVQ